MIRRDTILAKPIVLSASLLATVGLTTALAALVVGLDVSAAIGTACENRFALALGTYYLLAHHLAQP